MHGESRSKSKKQWCGASGVHLGVALLHQAGREKAKAGSTPLLHLTPHWSGRPTAQAF